MAEKKFYSFKDLINSGSAGENEHKASEPEVEKFPVVNVVTTKNKDKVTIKDQKVRDYSTKMITPENQEEKEGYKKINLLRDKVVKEKPYTRSEEYREHLKDPYKKEPKIIADYRSHVLDKLIELDDRNNPSVAESSPTPEKSEPQKIQHEKNRLPLEDLKLQEEIYDQANFWKRVLSEKTDSKERAERNDRELRDFNLSPYGWMKVAITNTLYKYKSELEAMKGKGGPKKKELENKIAINQAHLKNLDDAYERGIPLMLERNFTKDTIALDDGRTFDTVKSLPLINLITKHRDGKGYEILGAVQRGNEEIIVLRSDSGEHIDLRLSTAKRIMDEMQVKKENKTRGQIEREEKFAQIKAGNIVEVRIGGMKSKNITKYRILDVSNGKISFDNLTARARGQLVSKGSMPTDKMRDFLFGKDTAFVVEDGKKVPPPQTRTESAPTPKKKAEVAKSKPIKAEVKTPVEIKSPMLQKVLALENELGFPLNALVIARYLKLSKEESEALYNEYRTFNVPTTPAPLDKKLNATEPAKVEKVVVQEPIQEKQGPTSEQIARFEEYLRKDKEIEARIKELEEEIQKGMEKKDPQPEEIKTETIEEAQDREATERLKDTNNRMKEFVSVEKEALEPDFDKKIFAKAPMPQGFPEVDTKQRSNGEQIFEILVQPGGKKAYLGISKDPEVQKYPMAMNYDYYFKDSAVKNIRSISNESTRKDISLGKKRIITSNYGELELVDGYWRVIKPVEIQIIDN